MTSVCAGRAMTESSCIGQIATGLRSTDNCANSCHCHEGEPLIRHGASVSRTVPPVSLRLIPRARAPRRDVCVPQSGAALACHRHAIHYRVPASQPQGKADRTAGTGDTMNGTRRWPAPLASPGGSWREAPDEGHLRKQMMDRRSIRFVFAFVHPGAPIHDDCEERSDASIRFSRLKAPFFAFFAKTS